MPANPVPVHAMNVARRSGTGGRNFERKTNGLVGGVGRRATERGQVTCERAHRVGGLESVPVLPLPLPVRLDPAGKLRGIAVLGNGLVGNGGRRVCRSHPTSVNRGPSQSSIASVVAGGDWLGNDAKS